MGVVAVTSSDNPKVAKGWRLLMVDGESVGESAAEVDARERRCRAVPMSMRLQKQSGWIQELVLNF